MPTIEQPIAACLKCGGALWDNRLKKNGPKSPDFRCRNKDCGEAYWLKNAQKGPSAPVSRTNPPQRDIAPRWTWASLAETYHLSVKLGEKEVLALAKAHKVPFTVENVLAAAATVFINAARDGVAKPVKKVEPPPLDEMPPQLEEEDSEMPF